MIEYRLHSRDPDGSFHECQWSTPIMPEIGDQVMLPYRADGTHWQEMTVEERQIRPHYVDVWIGGTQGRGDGSVAELFAYAKMYYRDHQQSPAPSLARVCLAILRNAEGRMHVVEVENRLAGLGRHDSSDSVVAALGYLVDHHASVLLVGAGYYEYRD